MKDHHIRQVVSSTICGVAHGYAGLATLREAMRLQTTADDCAAWDRDVLGIGRQKTIEQQAAGFPSDHERVARHFHVATSFHEQGAVGPMDVTTFIQGLNASGQLMDAGWITQQALSLQDDVEHRIEALGHFLVEASQTRAAAQIFAAIETAAVIPTLAVAIREPALSGPATVAQMRAAAQYVADMGHLAVVSPLRRGVQQ